MAQKSILSFFKSSEPDSSKETKIKKVVIYDSPVKKSKNKRKVKCIESDDESDIPKNLNGESSKVSEGSADQTEKSLKSSSKKVQKKNNETKRNGTQVSRKPSKQKKVEETPTTSPESPIKAEADSLEHKDESFEQEATNSNSPSKMEVELSSNVTNNDSKSKSEDEPSSNQNGFVDFIPKRKTARKQISSSKKRKSNDVKVVNTESESKISGNETTSKSTSDNTADVENENLNSNVKDAKNKSTDSDSENNEIDSDDKNISKDSKVSDDDKMSKDSKVSDDKKISKDSKDSDDKKISKHSKDLDNKELSKDSKDSVDEKISNGSKDSDDKKISKNAKDSGNKKVYKGSKDLNNKKISKDAKSTDVKQKAISSSKVKGSPLKKSAQKESIHSFFSPLKKAKNNLEDNTQDNLEEDSKESQQVEIEDSPVKSVRKQKKKLQCLESDDENDETEKSLNSPVKVKKETDDSELNNSSASPQKKENSIKTPEKTTSEAKKSPQKADNESSMKNDEKQKLCVKSTSADTTVYDPSKNHYHPIDDACWKKGEKVPYLALAKTLELIENTPGRLKTIEILSNFLRSVIVLSPDDFLQSVYLCLNRLAPEYAGIELGVGETLLMKAVAQATGRTVEKIKAEVAIKGDLGLVSESSRGNQRVMFAPPKLTVSSVFSKFLEIAKMSGNASMGKKTDKIKVLFVACRDCEAKYIIRSLSGKLRIGLAEQSVLSAIARAAVLTPPGQTYPPKKIDASKGLSSEKFKELLDSQTLILKTAYCECPNYDLVIPVLLKEGISSLPERCQLSPGVPLKPMLAHPTAGIDKVLERFDRNAFTCEFKYDGERAQIHMTEKGDVKIFSRNQEDNTTKYPDIISRLPNALKESTKSFVLDSEAVAWDKETKQILPFQVLSTRKRKDAVESEIVVQVCIMAFDLLYLNGESLVKKSLKERRSLLHSAFNEVENEFMFARYRDGDSAETMQEFLDESVKGNCEGLMVKSLEVDASYEIAKRSHNWLKLKKDYLQGVGDTLDLVVIGGYYGKGKRTGNYGGFLLACYDEENEEFQSICKLGTGFKDDNLEAHTTFLKEHIINEPKSYFRYDHSLEPDEWFEPIQVWEIKCADLSISPVHKAAIGIVDPEKGISLRFPRFIRIRDDKTPENATNSVQIADMYQKQQQIQNTSNKNAKAEEDYY